MRFEWDDDKSRLNLLKHGIDFEEAKNLWLDENRIQIRTPYPVENRGILIANTKESYGLQYLPCEVDATHIISVRRARSDVAAEKNHSPLGLEVSSPASSKPNQSEN